MAMSDDGRALGFMPVLLPVAFLVLLVWAIARATRKPVVVVTSTSH